MERTYFAIDLKSLLDEKPGDEGIIWREGPKKNGKWCVREDV